MARLKLLVRHHDFDAAGFLVHHHLGHFGGRQRVHHEGRGLRRPGDDVDLFALQLLHHRLHAAAAHADAGADRVDRAVAADHRHFRPAAGIARDRLDLDDAVVDFRHFLGEQFRQEAGMRTGEKNLRPARFLAHIIDVRTNPVAVAKTLAGDQLVTAQQRLGPAEFDHQVAVLGALHHTVDDFADAVLELVVLPLALIFAHPLHDHLLGGLRRNAAEIDRRQRIDDELADIDVRLELAGNVDGDLGFLVLHRLDRFGPARQPHVAGLAVDRGADVLFMPILRAASLLDGLLHGLQHFLAVDVLLARDRVGNQKKFGAGDCGVHDDLCQLVRVGVELASIRASVSTSLARRISVIGKAISVPSSRRRRAAVGSAPSTMP